MKWRQKYYFHNFSCHYLLTAIILRLWFARDIWRYRNVFCFLDWLITLLINWKVRTGYMRISRRCSDTSELRHFGHKTFRHYVFGAGMSHIFALVPKCPINTSAPVPKCLGQFGTRVHETHFGPRIKRCFDCRHCVKKRTTNFIVATVIKWKCLENDWPKLYLSQSLACEQSRTVGNKHNRSGSEGMQQQWAEMRR